MDFGKLKEIQAVNFTLPPDASSTQGVLQNLPKPNTKPRLYIGATGWGMPQWIGKIYPKVAKPNDFLRYYAQNFNTIELNTTHYRIPNAEMIESWVRDTPPDFRFCPKIPQVISHSKDLGMNGDALQQFCDVIQLLKNRLGCCFLQLPPTFLPQHSSVLERFLQIFPTEIPLAVEVRHESWFANTNSTDIFFNLLQRYHAAPVITDVSGRRDVLHQRLTNDTILIRFVGNSLHATDYTRVDAWAERLKYWSENGVSKIYFFTHEPDNLLSPELAVYVATKVEQLNFATVQKPIFIKENIQISLF
jgi:uncharacterized protein YecE (DUF72 family)